MCLFLKKEQDGGILEKQCPVVPLSLNVTYHCMAADRRKGHSDRLTAASRTDCASWLENHILSHKECPQQRNPWLPLYVHPHLRNSDGSQPFCSSPWGGVSCLIETLVRHYPSIHLNIRYHWGQYGLITDEDGDGGVRTELPMYGHSSFKKPELHAQFKKWGTKTRPSFYPKLIYLESSREEGISHK